MNIIIFSDIDGTLLNYNNYSHDEAKEALEYIKAHKIPLVLTTSKTYDETVEIMNELSLNEPFIIENGGGVYFPKIYNNKTVQFGVQKDEYKLLSLGVDINYLYSFAIKIKNEFNLILYNELSVEELIDITGLSMESALKSMNREYSLPFIMNNSNDEKIEALSLKSKEFNIKILKGGLFYSFVGIDQDKGRAANIVVKHLKELIGSSFVTIGIGDSGNDADMLNFVDMPILVKNRHGCYSDIKVKGLQKSTLIGPAGFNEMILKVLKSLGV
ncbi:MAG: HAD-IIB family hydrolase [Deferribacterota bacterium]|nr:HAD-IIB family hydrolase [Deferribacterota bacterium]